MALPTRAELLNIKAGYAAEMKSIVTKAEESGEGMSDEDNSRVDDLYDMCTKIDGRLAAIEKVTAVSADSGQAISDAMDEATDDLDDDDSKSYVPTVKAYRPTERVYASAKTPEKNPERKAIIAALANAYDTLPPQAFDGNKKWANGLAMVKANFGESAVTKALGATTATGSNLIRQAFLPELVAYLRAEVAVRKMNPRIIPMGDGNLRIPRQTGVTTAVWQAEQADLQISAVTADQIVLNAQRLTAMSDITNELIARSPISAADMIQRDLQMQVERAEDITYIRNTTAGAGPLGLLSLATAASNVITAPTLTGTSTDAQLVLNFLSALRNRLDRANVPMRNCGWIMSPVTRNYILTLRNSLGYPYFDELQANGTLLGYRVVTTTQIPESLTSAGGTHGSEIYFADFSEVIIGETQNPILEVSREAAYLNSSGVLISAWSQNLTVFRLIQSSDFNINHLASVAVGLVDGWQLS